MKFTLNSTMNEVKGLLLGSAAGVFVLTVGHAADLPVKAKPVEYVKICSIYGAGFYYMPGTDVCLKVGGWVRFEGGSGSLFNGSFTTGMLGDTNQRGTSNTVFRARAYITADARSETEFGTARAYFAVGLQTTDIGLNTAGNQFSANRAFIQWAGITAGVARSFYDYYAVPATSYWVIPASDTGDGGWLVAGYTAQLGNGLSTTLAMETRRTTQIIDQEAIGVAAGGGVTPGAYPATVGGGLSPGAGAYGGQQLGDIVDNVHLEQAWGSAQIMGALHQVNATYYSTGIGAAPAAGSPLGHPDDAWGWAAGGGFTLFTPVIGQGDFFQTQFNISRGALRYLFDVPNGNWGSTEGAASSFGVLSDAVYGGSGAGNITSLQLTSAWGFNAGYEHHWNPEWHTSLYGGYDKVTYNTSANAMLCSGTTALFGSREGAAAVAAPGCNNDWAVWYLGSRTQWDVTKTFYLGIDALYENIHSGTLPTVTAGGAPTLGPYSLGSSTTIASNTGLWGVRIRVHKDFLP